MNEYMKIAKDLSGCEIYAFCYPCPMCLSAIILQM